MINTDDYAGTGMWSARTSEFNLDSYGAPADIPEMKAEWDAYIEETGNHQSQYLSAWVPDTTSIETEYAACTNVIQQYWWPLECGFVEDLEAGLEEYATQMKAAGAEKVIETLQAQLDAFVRSIRRADFRQQTLAPLSARVYNETGWRRWGVNLHRPFRAGKPVRTNGRTACCQPTERNLFYE